MPAALLGGTAATHTPAPVEPVAFGRALVVAARRQLGDLVIYNARYARISYPMGDVAGLYGVCTDVVVRAYRALGIDLQELISKTGSGRGDRNIDHRRVDVVRRFFERFGQSLAISEFAENYQPGDIVTYYRPQNRTSTSHIAVVSDQLAPSGRLMIIHNRGWGPQLEDALFVDKITGHYRFHGIGVTPAPASASKGPARTDAPPNQGLNRTPWQVASISGRPEPSPVSATLAFAGPGRTARAICKREPSGIPAEHTRVTAGETPRTGVPNSRKSRVAAMRTASAITPNR